MPQGHPRCFAPPELVQCTSIGDLNVVVGEFTQDTEILIIGAGPAGLGAAERCTQLGKQVVLVDPGMTGETIAGVDCLQGKVRFADKRSAQITGEHVSRVRFNRAIVCTGASMGPTCLRGLNASRRWNDEPSSGRVLIVGNGILAIHTAMRYLQSDSEVVLASPTSRMLPDFDPVLCNAVLENLACSQIDFIPDTTIAQVNQDNDSAMVVLDEGTVLGEFDAVIPTQPIAGHVDELDLHTTAAHIENGWISVDATGRTAENRILAAGAVTGQVGQPAACHRHGQMVANTACGQDAHWEPTATAMILDSPIPASWCGLDESAANGMGLDAATIGHEHDGGMVRLVHETGSGLLLGAGAIGENAHLIAETAIMAMEMGATLEDLAAMIPSRTDGTTLGSIAFSNWTRSK